MPGCVASFVTNSVTREEGVRDAHRSSSTLAMPGRFAGDAPGRKVPGVHTVSASPRGHFAGRAPGRKVSGRCAPFMRVHEVALVGKVDGGVEA